MIKLFKGPEPEILAKKKEQWTNELIQAVKSGDKKKINAKTKRYNHPDVKSALKNETNEKCAYCEARVTDVAHGDIEHVTPKSKDRSATFSWANLTFACQICNQKKSTKENIIDPYLVDPKDHLFFAGPFAKGKTENGSETVLELDLNRTALLESRIREIERYAGELEKASLSTNKGLKRLIIDKLLQDLETGKPEFVAACRVIIENYRSQL